MKNQYVPRFMLGVVVTEHRMHKTSLLEIGDEREDENQKW